MPTPTSDAVLTRLMDLHPKLIDLSLDRVEVLLDRLGNPHRNLPPVVHVAGTNAKGSVIAMMRAALEAAGRDAHVYTSPHLVRFHERIRVAGSLIDESDLTALLEECETANGGAPITFFEITTVAAFLAFSRAKADIVLLETGLGGRLDATNLIDEPLLTVITPVSLDHQQFLGDSLSAIATEKAGILKPGVPCVVARQMPAALQAIEARADEIGAPLRRQDVDWRVSGKIDHLVFEFGADRRIYPMPALQGAHQIGNAGLALAALASMGDLTPSYDAQCEGLKAAEWPARMQRLVKGALVDMLPSGWELWLDGGHNQAAGEMLGAHADATWSDRPLHVVTGMMNSKEARSFLVPLARAARDIATVAIPGEENSFSADDLAGMARDAGGREVDAFASVADALAAISRKGDAAARVLICGSLYLAGRVLAENGEA